MRLLFALSALALTACVSVTPSTLQATQGQQKQIQNSVTTTASFDVVWDAVVAKLAQSFFVINNIDKQSRIINVSFTSNSPEMYADCGTSLRQFDFQNEHRTYEYPVAQSSVYKAMTTWRNGYTELPGVATVSRDTSLEGRANIYIAPGPDGIGSLVTVNAIYVWSVQVGGYIDGYNVVGALMVPKIRMDPSPPSSINFTTQAAGSAGVGEDKMTCASTGQFEESILVFVPRQ